MSSRDNGGSNSTPIIYTTVMQWQQTGVQCACVRAYVRASVRASVRARARVCVCVYIRVFMLICIQSVVYVV